MNKKGAKTAFKDFLESRSERSWLKEYRQNRFEDLKKSEEPLSGPAESGVVKINVSKTSQKSGLVALEINEALKKQPEIVKKYFLKEKRGPESFGSCPDAFFTTGCFVFAPKGAEGKAAIEISPQRGTGFVKNIIALEQENRVFVNERISSNSGGKKGAALACSSNAFVENSSKLDFSSLNELNLKSALVSSRCVVIGNDSGLRALHGWLGARESRSSIQNHLVGKGAEARHMEVLFGSEGQKFDLTSDILHEAPGTRARVLVRGCLKDESSSAFRGMIKILEGCQKTDSFLECHSILLGRNASSSNLPSLEIEANDVKASHSASVRRLDEEEVFYLKSRGISETEARRILVSSFFGAVADKPGQEAMQRFLEGIAQKYGK